MKKDDRVAALESEAIDLAGQLDIYKTDAIALRFWIGESVDGITVRYGLSRHVVENNIRWFMSRKG
jgi:hypothetical protein